jgi:competence protein ComFC
MTDPLRPPPGGLYTPSYSIRHILRQFSNAALNLLYPPQCIGCDRRIGSLFCNDCQSRLTPVAAVQDPNSPLEARQSTAVFDGTIRKAIHELKYSRQRGFAEVLGKRLVNALCDLGWPVTALTAVPLHENRIKERGFNQAALLADYVAMELSIPFHANMVRRVRDTRQQVGLNARERQSNVNGAFEADQTIVRGQKVVIIDDVYTTGATLRACASALREAGAIQVWALTVASASLDQNP